jgi:hypothetical protein
MTIGQFSVPLQCLWADVTGRPITLPAVEERAERQSGRLDELAFLCSSDQLSQFQTGFALGASERFVSRHPFAANERVWG